LTADTIFGINDLVARISRSFAPAPGGAILKGPPPGFGYIRRPTCPYWNCEEVVVSIQGLGSAGTPSTSFANWRKEQLVADLEALQRAIEAGDRATAVRITSEAVEEEMSPRTVLGAMTSAMEVVGGRFQRNEIYVPEMLISARAMKEAMGILEPVLTASGIRPEYTAVIGTIKGDLHDIGKNLVAMMWRGANIQVVDLGTNVTAAQFVDGAREHRATIVGISALLTTTMVGMKDAVTAIRAADLGDIKVIVGGAPVTAEFAASIGADGYAPDAASAVQIAKQAIGPM
jgi:5-methyltetrahydrofolate--homocysteine methyltransferase